MKKQAILAIVCKKTREGYHYLLLKRIPSRGGFWQPVSGRVEEGETPLAAAKREVIEETGIKKFLRTVENVYTFRLENEPDKESFTFGFEVNPQTKIALDKNIYPEHDETMWCNAKEAVKLLKWPHNKEGLRRLDEQLRIRDN